MKKILIVGASSGIGEGLAQWYAGIGDAKVGITGRRLERLKKMSAAYPGQIEYEAFDVQNVESIEPALERLAARLGGVDLLVLSAGTGDLNPGLDYTKECPTLQTNVLGWTCVADWAVHYFERQGHGHLAAITSVGGLRGSDAAPAYNATKAFQMNYLEGVSQRCAASGFPIYITDIRPGFVDTAMAKGEGLFWVAPVDKVCRQIVHGIARRKAVVYVTRRWRWAAFIYRNIPRRLFKRMQG